ncbi:MAG: MAPEG family protein [Deltaproteobacteria bacterium]|nr:MAPEG family protein [Deltaproteobacteria bacterium]
MAQPILAPMLALILWTFVIWVWMYATRIPAMRAAGIDPAKIKSKSDLDVLPASAKQVADNYNHLHEQPVLFYALVLWCVLGGTADSTNVALAWTYFGVRVVHSLIQCTINFIPARFAVFTIGSIVLFVIALRCLPAAMG